MQTAMDPKTHGRRTFSRLTSSRRDRRDVAQRTLAGDGVQIERLRLQEKFQLVTRCHKRIDHADFQAFEVRAVDAQRLQRDFRSMRYLHEARIVQQAKVRLNDLKLDVDRASIRDLHLA